MAQQKPVYLFVGGVSHTPVFWDATIKFMSFYGHESAAIPYPTCGDNTEITKQWDEVIAIQQATLKVLNRGKDVVLVLHSYGGWPGSRAIKGLDKATRTAEGEAAGIVEVVFLAAFLLPDNAPMAAYSYLPPWLTVKNGRRIPNETAIPLLFNDLDLEAQKYWLSQFAWQKNDFTKDTVPDAPWHLSIPKTFIITMGDKAATLDIQLKMLQGVIDETWAIKSIRSGHEPFLSQPENLVKVLLQPTF